MIRTIIVDDDPLIRKHIQKKIEDMACEFIVCETLSNGKEALDWLKLHYADVCVVDIQMPGMDGLSLIEEIRLQYPWMAGIVISSYNFFDYAQRAIQLGIVDYLLKPIDGNELVHTFSNARDKIIKARKQSAYKIMFQNISSHQDMYQRWIEAIQMVKHEELPSLISETAEMLKLWVKNEHYLLSKITLAWLETISQKLLLNQPLDKYVNNHETAMNTLRHSELPNLLYEQSVYSLEKGIRHMIDSIKQLPNHQYNQLVYEVKSFIDQRYALEITLEDIAEHVAMSKNHIAKLFKEETGETIWNYVVNVRMNKARELVLEGRLRSYEIAERVGYKDAIYFSQLFKRTYGMNPMEYKKKIKKAI